MPKAKKYRTQKLAQGQIAQHKSNHKPTAAAQTDIRLAYPKGQNHPGIEAYAKKEQVGKCGEAGAQRSQKTIHYPKSTAQCKGNPKMLQRFPGGDHPRPQKLRFCRGSS